MKKKNVVAALVVGFVIAAVIFSWMRFQPRDSLDAKVGELQAEVTSQRNELLGYTKYTDYLTAGKKQLNAQMKFVAATVVREESYTREVKKNILGMTSDSVVAIWYNTEYSFGYTLKPGDYEISATDTGVNVTLKRPVLVTRPASSRLRHKILSGGVFVNSQAAINGLYQGIADRTEESGRMLATDEAVIALCEKNFRAFLRDFFAKQPGVKHLPDITITYK